jgi:hypothetical protein
VHSPSDEQGGISHLSVLPQQVVPFGVALPILIAPGEERSFSILAELQKGQVMEFSCFRFSEESLFFCCIQYICIRIWAFKNPLGLN